MSYRILHILDCFLPETMNWLEALLVQSQEHCVHHIYALYYTRKPNIQFHYVPAGVLVKYPLSKMTKLKIRLSAFNDQQILQKYITDHNIQMVHFHFGHVAIEHKKWIAHLHLPFCVSLYGFDYEYLVYKKPTVRREYQKLSLLGGLFIVEGNYSKNLLEKYGVPPAQIFKVHMLFDRQVKQLNQRYIQPIRLFQAASYTPKKNQLELISALQNRHAGKFILSFFGEPADKKYANELKKMAKTKSRHTISLNDKLQWSDYLKELGNCHFTINLSKRSSEMDTEGGCPVLIKDGLSLGKPILTTRHCDIPEWIIENFNGFLIDENDNQQIANLLDQILVLSEYQYLQLCTNARQSVEANMKQNITSNELISIYRSSL